MSGLRDRLKPLQKAWPRLVRNHVVHPLQAALAYAAYGVLRCVPIDVASAIGAWAARTIGMRIGATRHGDRNLQLVMPELTAKERRRILTGMWDNLGRVLGEYPHLRALGRKETRRADRITVDGIENYHAARADGRPVIMALAHFGNWEAGPIVATRHGAPLTIFVRPLNNRLVDRLVRGVRLSLGTGLLEKRMAGNDARRALGLLRNGGVLGVMVDQRYTGGLKVPFIGQDALTSPAAVEMAYHFNCALLPMRVERTRGARYRAVIDPPLDIPRTGDRKADVEEGVIRLNRVVEAWIRARPEQWLWLHKRWRLTPKRPIKPPRVMRQASPPSQAA
jgi:KDO2-lipid IV(A) lauroyltransferase